MRCEMEESEKKKTSLTEQQYIAIAARLSGATVKEAADKAGSHERSVYRWKAENELFQEALNKGLTRMTDVAVYRMTHLLEKGLEVVEEILNDPEAKNSDKLRAYQIVTQNQEKYLKTHVHAQRIAELENKLKEIENELEQTTR